jgi:Zn-dependent oligopeptidase
MFTLFEANGIMNPEMGAKYRNVVLAPGGTKDAFDVIEEFLGRKPNNDAYLDKLGFNKEVLIVH